MSELCLQQDISYSALLVPSNRNFGKHVTVNDTSTVNTSESSQSSQGIFVIFAADIDVVELLALVLSLDS